MLLNLEEMLYFQLEVLHRGAKVSNDYWSHLGVVITVDGDYMKHTGSVWRVATIERLIFVGIATFRLPD
jgi:hypothetical protein